MSYYKVNDLVSYRAAQKLVPPVKGKVTAVFNDVFGWTVAFVVTSRAHPLYAPGTELCTGADDPRLHKRERYAHGTSQA